MEKKNDLNRKKVNDLLAQFNRSAADEEKDFDREQARERVRISTGILDLDIAMGGGFSDELIMLAGEPATGKSTFAMTLAQNVAEQGIDVFYVTTEMSKKQFYARGISAISFKHHASNSECPRYTESDILDWVYDEESKSFYKLNPSRYENYKSEYFERFGGHLRFLRQNGLTAATLVEAVKEHKLSTDEPVVVFVDYMQMIKAVNDRITDRKSVMDEVVETLKDLVSYGVPVIAISSINRNSYGGGLKMSALKESGDLEFFAERILALEHIGKFDGGERVKLDFLKARRGKKINFEMNYFPAYNAFSDWIPVDAVDEVPAGLENKKATEYYQEKLPIKKSSFRVAR